MFKKISIIIPCFNEIRTIDILLKKIIDSDTCGLKKEIIIVDDCSTDGTVLFLKKIVKEKSNIKVFFHRKNKGKGVSLKTGFLQSTGDIILIQDADLEYDPENYPTLLKPILRGDADIVYGSRFIGFNPHRVMYFWHSAANKFLTLFSNILTNINLTDMETCYKVFTRPVLKGIVNNLKSPRFGFEPEFTAKVSRLNNIKIYEVGISYYGRSYKEGKHITWKDGVKAFFQIIKFNLLSK